MIHFPYIALPLGILFFLIVSIGRQVDAEGATALPLLTLLVLSEFAFFATGIAAFIGFKQTRVDGFKPVYVVSSVLCLLLSISFMFLGITLWPL